VSRCRTGYAHAPRGAEALVGGRSPPYTGSLRAAQDMRILQLRGERAGAYGSWRARKTSGDTFCMMISQFKLK
jgi:hypothetical protein